MKQTNLRLTELFHKYMENNMIELERAEFSDYIDDPVYSDEIQDLLGEAFRNQGNSESLSADARARVLAHILGTGYADAQPGALTRWKQVLAVAAAVAGITFSVWAYYANKTAGPLQGGSQYSNDVAPGKQGATLTLASGKMIRLGDTQNGELAKEKGVVISKSANGQLVYQIKADTDTKRPPSPVDESGVTNVLSTAKGETYLVNLPDKSKVWLNALSSITYSTTLNKNGERRVKLDGEAYFEVAKDKKHPFIVESNGQDVTVLGTHFNINSYKNESAVKTTLLEGSVRVRPSGASADGAEHAVILRPGQQATFTREKIKVSEADIEEAMAWKNGKFIFRDESLTSIMRKVSIWYDVEIVYTVDVNDLTYWGSLSRNANISAVLNYLSKTGNVSFEIQGRKVKVSAKKTTNNK